MYLLLILTLLTTQVFPHERGNGRPRYPSRQQEEQQEQQEQRPQQQQQQQQQQGDFQVTDPESFFDEIWDAVKAEDLNRVAIASNQALVLEITSEYLIEELLSFYPEERHLEIMALLEIKKAAVSDKFVASTMDDTSMDLAVTGYAILLTLADLKK